MLDCSLADSPPPAEAVASFVRDSVGKHCKHLLLVGDLTDLNAIDITGWAQVNGFRGDTSHGQSVASEQAFRRSGAGKGSKVLKR